MTDSGLVLVSEVGEVKPDERKIVNVDGLSIGLFNIDGEYYAIRNECPHQGGPVCSGDVHGAIDADFTGAGERLDTKITDRTAITCPWHGWEYDLETGDHLGTESITLTTYEVIVEDSEIYVNV